MLPPEPRLSPLSVLPPLLIIQTFVPGSSPRSLSRSALGKHHVLSVASASRFSVPAGVLKTLHLTMSPSRPTCYGGCPARAVQDEALSPRHVACDPRLPSARSSPLYQILTLFSQVLSKASDLLDRLMFAGTCGGNRLSTIAAPSPLFFLSDSSPQSLQNGKTGPQFPTSSMVGREKKQNE